MLSARALAQPAQFEGIVATALDRLTTPAARPRRAA